MEQEMKILLGVFMAVIVGIVLLEVVADSVYDSTTLYTVTDESLTIAAAESDGNNATTSKTRYVTLIAAGNGSSAFTVGTTINYTSDGKLYTGSKMAGTMTANYTYGEAGYVAQATSRTLVSLITLLFAIGLIGIAIVAAIWYLKNNNMMG